MQDCGHECRFAKAKCWLVIVRTDLRKRKADLEPWPTRKKVGLHARKAVVFSVSASISRRRVSADARLADFTQFQDNNNGANAIRLNARRNKSRSAERPESHGHNVIADAVAIVAHREFR